LTYVPHTDADRRAMLDAIGVETLEDLFADVPRDRRFPGLDLPPQSSELEVDRELRELAARNVDGTRRPCFLGAGSARHYVPATVDAVLRRGEFYSSYTPYQPELSQGFLQATFEYQSMICRLTGMDVSTASHYDGATALAEAVLLALAATGRERDRVLVSPSLHPQYREVLETYLAGTSALLERGDAPDPDASRLAARLDRRSAACVVQSPNFFGQLEPVRELAEAAHAAGALLVVVPDPIALGLFRSPGEDGADLVAAEGQPLGIPVCFGGPHLGILATRQAHVRRTAGRLVGQTLDAAGERGWVLTLSAREQHIRRERATSNICTNAALMALAAAVYLCTLGRSGLRRVAELCYHKSHYAASRIAALPGCRVNPQAPHRPFFKEFVVELPIPAERANRFLLEEFDILGGLGLARHRPELENHLLLAVTELHSRAEIDRLVTALEAATRAGGDGS
jgi:glycine dehydrogenase subunit 1